MTKTETIDGVKYLVSSERCTCECHNPKYDMMHFQACCNNGWIETKIPIKD